MLQLSSEKATTDTQCTLAWHQTHAEEFSVPVAENGFKP